MENSSEIAISIIVPTLGDWAKLKRLLNSISLQNGPFGFEVLIVDNSQHELTDSQILKLFEGYLFSVRILNSPLGVNHARNRGVEAAVGSLILFVDDDCWMADPHLLLKHAQFHKTYPDIFAIGGQYILPDTAKLSDRVYHGIQMKWLHSGYEVGKGGSHRFLIGGHFSMKKEVALEKNLRFNPVIRYGGSELSFFLNAYNIGLQMRLENLGVVHETQETLFSLTRKLFKQGQGKAVLDENLAKLEAYQETPQEGSQLVSLYWGYLDVIFWLGYYQKKKNILQFFRRYILLFNSKMNSKRYDLLSKIEKEKQKKIDRGDRL